MSQKEKEYDRVSVHCLEHFYSLQDWGSLLSYPFKSKMDSQFAVLHSHGLWTVSISITEELLDLIPVPLKQNLWGQNLGNKLSRWLSIKEASEYKAGVLFCCTSSVSKLERAQENIPPPREQKGGGMIYPLLWEFGIEWICIAKAEEHFAKEMWYWDSVIVRGKIIRVKCS